MSKPDKRDDIHDKTTDLIHEWLTKGVLCIGPKGEPVLDDDGKETYKPLRPKDMGPVLAYLKSTKPGVKSQITDDSGVAGRIAKAAQGRSAQSA